MALIQNFVLETCNAPGTGSVTLAGAPAGRRTFASAFAAGSMVYYFMDDGAQAEWGIGTFVGGTPAVLNRTTVIGNTAGTTTARNFTGTTRIYNDVPAERLATTDSSAETVLGTYPGTAGATNINAPVPTGFSRFAVEFDITTDHSLAATGYVFLGVSYDGGSTYTNGTSWSCSTQTDGVVGLGTANGYFPLTGVCNGPWSGRLEWSNSTKLFRAFTTLVMTNSSGQPQAHTCQAGGQDTRSGTPTNFALGNTAGNIGAGSFARLIGFSV